MKKITLNLLALLVTCCMWQVSAQTFAGAGNPQPVPAVGTGGFPCTGGPTTSAAAVTSVSGSSVIGINVGDYSIEGVNVDITHTFDADIEMTLIAPDGTSLDLSSDNGGAGDNYTGTMFVDGAPNITTGAAPFTGMFEPEAGTFATTFDGVAVDGNWTLSICDDAGGDSGTLTNFEIIFGEVLSCSGTSTAIAGGMPAETYTNVFNVAAMGVIGEDTDDFTINSVTLDDFQADTANEIIVSLISPAGTSLILMDNRGGLDGLDTPQDLTFSDDGADVTAWAGGAPMADYMAEGGLFSDEMMGAFEDESVNGDWTLSIFNGGNGAGDLADFCFDITNNGLVGTIPTISCPMDIVVDNDPGVCGAEVNFADAAAVDAEDGALAVTQTAGDPSMSIFPVGDNVITFEATDSDGNTVECSFTITVNDIDVPTMECPEDILVANDAGVCGAMVTVPMPTIMDNCATDLTPAPSATSGDIPLNRPGDGNLSFITVTIPSVVPSAGGNVVVDVLYNGDFSFNTEALVLVDENGDTVLNVGNTGVDCADFTAQFSYSQTDWNDLVTNFGPDLDFVVQPDADVNDFCTDAFVNLTATIGSQATLINDFNGTADASGLYPVGTTTVTYTYTDPAGNSVDCSMDVTVEDTEAPVIVCEGAPGTMTDTEVGTSGDPIDSAVAPATNTITVAADETILDLNIDLDISHTWIGDMSMDLTSPAGTTVRIYDQPGTTVTDGTGVGCNGDDILATLDDEAATAVEDECGTGTIPAIDGSFMPNSPLSAFDGESSMGDWTLTITDNTGGDTGTFNSWGLVYTYESGSLPPLDVVLDVDGMATVNAADMLISATDNCGVALINTGAPAVPGSLANTDFAFFDSAFPGIMFDINALADTTINSFDVDLFDRGGGGDATIEVYYKDGTHVGSETTAGDWTLLETVTVTPNATAEADALGLSLTQTIAAGSTGAFYITVDQPFNAGAGWNIIAVNDGSAIGASTAADSAIDILQGQLLSYPFDDSFIAAGTAGFMQNINVLYTEGSGVATSLDFTCDDVGENTVTVNVTDAAGNTSSCEAVLNVIDDIDPMVVCADFTLELDDDGVATLDPTSLIDMTMSVEACGYDIVTADITEFDCSNIGTPTLVTIFVADPSGNIASCSAMVDVVDVNGPVLTCPDDQTVVTAPGTGQYIMEDFVPMVVATDGCTDPVTVIAQDPAVGTAIGVGTQTVTITAQDDLGNESTCTFELTILFDELGVDDNNLEAAISMYPNPANDIVNITNNSTVVLERAAIYDVNGKLVSDINLEGMQTERAIDVSALASGVYVVQISGQGATVAKRLIIE